MSGYPCRLILCLPLWWIVSAHAAPELPIWAAASWRNDIATVRAHIDAGTNIDMVDDWTGKTALHYAAEYNSCEPEVFTAVLEAHPEAARHKNKWGQLPIHYATWRRAPPEIIRQLHEAYPEGAELTDTLAGFSAEQTILNTSLKSGEAEAATAS